MATKPDGSSFYSRNEFFIRRIHSLTGLVPVGAYMIVHLVTNASIWNGVETFQNAVFTIHGLGSILPVVEWAFIFLPIIFHGGLGVFIAIEGNSNYSSYPYTGNIRYTIQRGTGLIAFLFIAYHVFHLHGWFHSEWWLETVAAPLGGAAFRPYNAASSAATALRGVFPTIIYFVGVASCVIHFANGLWTMGITWGLWTTPKSQQFADRLCLGVGAVILAIGLAAWAGFTFQVDVEEATGIEDRMYKVQTEAGLVLPDDHKRSGDHGSVSQGNRPAE